MKNAILVPGTPSKDEHYDPKRPPNSEDNWFSWLRRQLILKDILAVSIEFPYPFRPRYDVWKKEFERFDLSPETILVGHSCGGGFLIRYLSEHEDLKVGKTIIVAPWTNPDNDPDYDTADFFEFEIDPEFPNRTQGVTVFISSDDSSDVNKTVEILKKNVKSIKYKEYTNKGHFCKEDLGGVDFPELLEELEI